MTDDAISRNRNRQSAQDSLATLENAIAIIREAFDKDALQPWAFCYAIDGCLGNAAAAILSALLSVDFSKIDGVLDMSEISDDSFLRHKLAELNERGERIRVKDKNDQAQETVE